MSSFVSRNKPDWDELQQLLTKYGKSRRRLTGPGAAEVSELSFRSGP
jgi:hypothetical protein